MLATAPTPTTRCAVSAKALAAALTIALLLALIAISSDSFWIDEGLSAYKAAQPTVASWRSAMRGQDVQQPLYFAVLWVWEKAVGRGERPLRMANAPFFLLTVLGLWLALRDDRKRFLFAFLVLISSPFVWFYMDQARPYMLLLAASTLQFAAAYRLQSGATEVTRAWAWWFSASSALLAATSAMGLIWSGAAVAAILCTRGPGTLLTLPRRFPGAFAGLVAATAAGAGYYAWTLHAGQGAPRLGHTGPLNLVSIPYEFLGFAGMGPNRNLLRQAPLHALAPYSGVLLAFATAWGAVLLRVVVDPGPRRVSREALIFYGSFLLPAVALSIAACVWNMRLLPRHLTPVMPCIVCLIGLLCAKCWRGRGVGRFLVAVLLASSAFSAAELRFAARHKRDNYRYAAAVAAREACAGNLVLWAADPDTGLYYGLPATVPSGSAVMGHLRPTDCVIVLSKPDLYDRTGSIRSFIAANRFKATEHFEAFEVWRSPRSR